MKNVTIDSVGRITIKSIRDYILDKKLTDRDTIILHPKNFDEFILDYREEYKQAFVSPYTLLGVLIEVQSEHRIAYNSIGILRDDERYPYQNRKGIDVIQRLKDSHEMVFRCGWCGNIVDGLGRELDQEILQEKKKLLETRNNSDYVKNVQGYCCENRMNE